MIKVLLAEDHTIVRKGLCSLLHDEAEIGVVGEAQNGREAVEMVGRLRPDVVLMDISMPGLNGLEAARQIKARFPATRVLVLTQHATEEYVYQMLRAGVAGYVIKQAAPAELILAIKAVYSGDTFLSPSISKRVVEEYIRRMDTMVTSENSYERLTPREREVLQLIAEGHTSSEIAEILHVTVKTVGHHRTNLMGKLGIHNAAELTQYAIRKRVISLDS